jgi:nicotinamide mononucleotide transporter
VRIAALAPRAALWHVAVGIAGALALGYAMQRFTDAALPWLDAGLAAFSMVGTWWEARRHIAAWWLWIVVDTIYIGEYIYKDLRITAVLYAAFVVLAVIGLRKWQHATEMRPTAD